MGFGIKRPSKCYWSATKRLPEYQVLWRNCHFIIKFNSLSLSLFIFLFFFVFFFFDFFFFFGFLVSEFEMKAICKWLVFRPNFHRFAAQSSRNVGKIVILTPGPTRPVVYLFIYLFIYWFIYFHGIQKEIPCQIRVFAGPIFARGYWPKLHRSHASRLGTDNQVKSDRILFIVIETRTWWKSIGAPWKVRASRLVLTHEWIEPNLTWLSPTFKDNLMNPAPAQNRTLNK